MTKSTVTVLVDSGQMVTVKIYIGRMIRETVTKLRSQGRRTECFFRIKDKIFPMKFRRMMYDSKSDSFYEKLTVYSLIDK